jgi:hypothetical protein
LRYGALNFRQYTIDIRQHVIVPEAQDTIAVGLETPGALPIGRCILRMLPAIHFNDELRTMADKIDDIRTDANLPPEMTIDERQAMPQMRPECPLRIGRHLAHLPGVRALRRGDRTIPTCPPARLFARHRNHSSSFGPHP